MFVRTKKIKDKNYAYLVANEWTPWRSRQKVAKYLGRTHILERKEEQANSIASLTDAIIQELVNHGFQEHSGKYLKGKIIVNLERHTVREGKKSVVLGMNEGFLCRHTLKRLFNFEPEERPDKSAEKLATFILEAGLKLNNEQFVQLFEKVQF